MEEIWELIRHFNLARVIHNDLTVSNASAWHWWLAISPYSYKDGLIYIDKQKEEGVFYESKMLWALGNYSRFIRPGYQRLAVEINSQKQQTPELLVSAYESADKHDIVLVLVNSGINELNVDLTQDGMSHSIKSIYITSKDENLESTVVDGAASNFAIPARSIVTVVSER